MPGQIVILRDIIMKEISRETCPDVDINKAQDLLLVGDGFFIRLSNVTIVG
jgi:hypothetical protein